MRTDLGLSVNNSTSNAQDLQTGSLPRRLVQRVLGLFGLRIVRIHQDAPSGAHKYFNTGKLLPLEENSVELNNTFYSDEQALSEYYGADRLSFYDNVSAYLQGAGLAFDGKRILDVGCGVGFLLAALKTWTRPESMSGCDFSEAAITASRKRFPGHKFFVQDIYQAIPGSYDIVLCTEVLEHLLHPDRGIQNLYRAVRPGGWLVVTVPNGRVDNIIEHINFWSPESWGVFLNDQFPGHDVKVDTFRAGQNNIAIIRRPGDAGPKQS